MTPESIFEHLKTESNSAFGLLYQHNFAPIRQFVLHNSGQLADAEDLFQEVLMVFLGKLRLDSFQLNATINTYLMAIAKNLWYKKLRNQSQVIDFTEAVSVALYDEIQCAIDQERTPEERVAHLLQQVTQHCQDFIDQVFIHDKTIAEIQQHYGYTTVHNAQNQKHKCLEQLRKAHDHSGMM